MHTLPGVVCCYRKNPRLGLNMVLRCTSSVFGPSTSSTSGTRRKPSQQRPNQGRRGDARARQNEYAEHYGTAETVLSSPQNTRQNISSQRKETKTADTRLRSFELETAFRAAPKTPPFSVRSI